MPTSKTKMKKVALFISIFLLFSLSAKAKDEKIRWKPQCRHNALYWGITVEEQYPTQIRYGYFKDLATDKIIEYHVQPQVKLGGNWYYFKVENGAVYIILDMNKYTEYTGDVWVPTYIFHTYEEYIAQFKKWREQEDVE